MTGTGDDQDEADLAASVIKIAHDVRTPLTAIRGYADVLLRRGDDLPVADRADLLDRIRSNAVRLEERITELTTLAQQSDPT